MRLKSLLSATLLMGVVAAGAVATGAAAAGTPGVMLWNGLRTGMSPFQVRHAFPAAEAPSDPLADAGYLATLQSPAPSLDGRPTRALFRFHNGRLFSVRLDVLSLKPGERAQNVQFASRLIAQLSRSTPAYDCYDNSRADVKLLDCKWLKDGVAVRLEYMDVAGQAPGLKILFSPVSDVGSDL